ncbi:type IV pilin protein [Pseudomonas bohemica]|uniref:type IV pilin protein n=1 Tax=Pseudomonas bohemica TaxID=2044872 RepID=UPI001F1FFC22|nr:type IV pilin protein [Pseudomonas bohemica]
MAERGFTLIELLITVAIIAILAGVAYPTYTEHTRKIRRSEIAALLVEEAHKLERFYSRAGQYSDAIGPPVRKHEVSQGSDFYAIDVERSEQTFVLKAMPVGGTLMSGDKCGGFVLENTGRRDNVGMSGDASVRGCWGR